ncbi:unnamed protein product [Ranitomeya imitator]|uniref:Uncharacterized protein n=1 Tax=Ranitomeya imitator TaxID=111125 RepID=A0ABN9LPS2_9NEOB|nr:unnamed protein product [Ranitomeya imitator]
MISKRSKVKEDTFHMYFEAKKTLYFEVYKPHWMIRCTLNLGAREKLYSIAVESGKMAVHVQMEISSPEILLISIFLYTAPGGHFPGVKRNDIVPVYQIKGISKLFKLCLPKVQCFCDSLTSPPSERQRHQHKYGLHGKVIRRKPLLYPHHKIQHQKYSEEHLNKPNAFCKQVLWTEGVKIELFGHNEQRRNPGPTASTYGLTRGKGSEDLISVPNDSQAISGEQMEGCVALQRNAIPHHYLPTAKLVMLKDAADSRSLSTASPDSVTSVTCTQCEPAFICEEYRAPVANLPILVFCGKCQASCTVLGSHLGRESRKEELHNAEDLFGSTSESDTSTFHGFDDEDDWEGPSSVQATNSPTAEDWGDC